MSRTIAPATITSTFPPLRSLEIRTQIGDDSARIDLAAADKPKEILYLTERPNYAAEFEKWVVLGRQVFGKGREPEKK